MPEGLYNKLFEYGILGILCVLSLVWNWRQYKRNQELEKEKDFIQNQRVEDVKEQMDIMAQMREVMKEFTGEVRGKMDSLRDAIRDLRGSK